MPIPFQSQWPAILVSAGGRWLDEAVACWGWQGIGSVSLIVSHTAALMIKDDAQRHGEKKKCWKQMSDKWQWRFKKNKASFVIDSVNPDFLNESNTGWFVSGSKQKAINNSKITCDATFHLHLSFVHPPSMYSLLPFQLLIVWYLPLFLVFCHQCQGSSIKAKVPQSGQCMLCGCRAKTLDWFQRSSSYVQKVSHSGLPSGDWSISVIEVKIAQFAGINCVRVCVCVQYVLV